MHPEQNTVSGQKDGRDISRGEHVKKCVPKRNRKTAGADQTVNDLIRYGG